MVTHGKRATTLFNNLDLGCSCSSGPSAETDVCLVETFASLRVSTFSRSRTTQKGNLRVALPLRNENGCVVGLRRVVQLLGGGETTKILILEPWVAAV